MKSVRNLRPSPLDGHRCREGSLPLALLACRSGPVLAQGSSRLLPLAVCGFRCRGPRFGLLPQERQGAAPVGTKGAWCARAAAAAGVEQLGDWALLAPRPGEGHEQPRKGSQYPWGEDEQQRASRFSS